MADGVDFFEPASRLVRWFSTARLPISEIARPGDGIKFLSSLKHDQMGLPTLVETVRHPLGSAVTWLVFVVAKLSGGNIDSSSSFMQSFTACASGTKSFDAFPFDTLIEFQGTSGGISYYRESDGTVWSVWNCMLANLCEVEIERHT